MSLDNCLRVSTLSLQTTKNVEVAIDQFSIDHPERNNHVTFLKIVDDYIEAGYTIYMGTNCGAYWAIQECDIMRKTNEQQVTLLDWSNKKKCLELDDIKNLYEWVKELLVDGFVCLLLYNDDDAYQYTVQLGPVKQHIDKLLRNNRLPVFIRFSQRESLKIREPIKTYTINFAPFYKEKNQQQK